MFNLDSTSNQSTMFYFTLLYPIQIWPKLILPNFYPFLFWLALSYPDLPILTLAYLFLPWLNFSYHGLPFITPNEQFLPWLTFPFHLLSWLASSYPDLPFLTISFPDLPLLILTHLFLPWPAFSYCNNRLYSPTHIIEAMNVCFYSYYTRWR